MIRLYYKAFAETRPGMPDNPIPMGSKGKTQRSISKFS